MTLRERCMIRPQTLSKETGQKAALAYQSVNVALLFLLKAVCRTQIRHAPRERMPNQRRRQVHQRTEQQPPHPKPADADALLHIKS